MEKTRFEKRFSHNKFTPGCFAKLSVAFEIIVVLLYVRYAATFSVYGNKLISLIVLTVILGAGGMALSIKRERNWISLLSGACIPVLIYEAFNMCKYSERIQTIICIGMVISLITAVLLALVNTRGIKKTGLRKSVLISKGVHFSRILCSILLIAVCIYGKVLINSHYTISMNDIEYLVSSGQNAVPDYENSLSANIDTVVKMDPDGGWPELTIDEKMDVLQTICRIECRYLGMRDSAPALELAYLEEGLLGQYNHETDKITLSYNYIVDTNASAYSICQVLCHELYHRYQRYQVNMLEAIRNSDDTAKYANLLLLDSASVYEDEMDNYITPTEDSRLSYYLYYSQRLERDAEKYGNEAVNDYYEQIGPMSRFSTS